ncbi:iron ABC transporter permease [Pendulispora brunnea]|uniref:Iron ABC transporter permease n=1 Tax=Pendulispora brunnea TaxID=2905690 RepID=A0ABZ2K5M0_9BACT
MLLPAALPLPQPRTRRRLILPGLIALLAASAILAAALGGVPLPPLEIAALLASKAGIALPVETTQEHTAIFFAIRLPRVVLGVLVGSGLGMAGAAMQGVFRNPLADPGLLGISSGGALGAVAAIVLGAHWAQAIAPWISAPHMLPVAAFLGALGAAWLVERLARVEGRIVVSMFLLAGIAVAALCAALTGLLTFTATDAQLRTILFWTLGSLGGATWKTVLATALFLAAPVALLPRFARALNALLLGESEARNLGVAADRVKKVTTVLIALAVGTSVAVSGVVGFIGLIVPHVVRLTAGPDHRVLLPGSALLGASLVLWADALARTAVLPAELPLGIVTASVGAPCFIALLVRERGRLG